MPNPTRAAAALAAALLATTIACDGGGGGGGGPTGPIPVASVTLSSSAEMLLPGATAQLTATARAADGSALSGRAISWTTSRSAVATVSSTGLVTAVDTGTAVIEATSEGRKASATITVVPLVGQVQVTPATADLVVNATTQLAATARTGAGAALPGRTFTWSSDNTAVATVTGSGLVTARGVGTARISATTGGVAGTAEIRVATQPPPTDANPPVLVSLGLNPDTVSVGTAEATVTVTMRVTDDASGVQSVTVNLVSPTRARTVAAVTYTPSGGTRLDGTWVLELKIPAGSETGTWTLTDIVLTDVGNRTRTLTTAQLQAITGVETTVVVRN